MIKKQLFRNIKSIFSRFSYNNDLKKAPKYFDSFYNSKLPVKNNLSDNVDYFEKDSKHRSIYNIFDLHPQINYYTFIAPNATIIGEVNIKMGCQVGYNSVIRGDINAVNIEESTCIGDHVVITTANCLPTGLPASVNLGRQNIIQNRVSLHSCTTNKTVFIGHGSVVLEGSIIEEGSVILPNSVVPPGRIIPASQVWGGNPVQYVRDLKAGEVFSNLANSYALWEIGSYHSDTFTPTNFTYLDREALKEDLDLSPEDIIGINYKSEIKLY